MLIPFAAGDFTAISQPITVRDTGGGYVYLAKSEKGLIIGGPYSPEVPFDSDGDDVSGVTFDVEFCNDGKMAYRGESLCVPAHFLRLVHTKT